MTVLRAHASVLGERAERAFVQPGDVGRDARERAVVQQPLPPPCRPHAALVRANCATICVAAGGDLQLATRRGVRPPF